MATLKVNIRDAVSGAPIEAKVHVLSAGGNSLQPADSVCKVGPGMPFFYCPGEFSLNAPRGSTDIIAERGTEYRPLRRVVSMPAKGTVEVELQLERWIDLPARNWYPGNTHIHYNELEANPDLRLQLDPAVHDLSVTAISVLQRGEKPYVSNKYPVGFMTDFSSDHRQVICGEESRHNSGHGGGYGHVMLLNLRNLVEPVSRGDLISAFDPDYPPLCYACDDARTQGGVVIWCHNGRGMEVPVAAALGKLDAFNLFDPCWKEKEYDIWYLLLNCGIHLPASTGSDWFICSNNRVYVQAGESFDYASWLRGLQAGRTFITNGPALLFEVEGHPPGSTIDTAPASGRLSTRIEWTSHYSLNRIEVIADGQIVDSRVLAEPAEQREGVWELDVASEHDGWLAARAFGEARDSFDQPVYAHTSPVYIASGLPPNAVSESATFFQTAIDEAQEHLKHYRFTKDEQRQEVQHLFAEGRKVYADLLR